MGLCKHSNANSNTNSNANSHSAYHQIDPNYGQIECVKRSCKECGKNLVLFKNLEYNPNLETDPAPYEYIANGTGQKGSKVQKVGAPKKNGTLYQIVTIFASQLDDLVYHIFSHNWN